jgi:hypothetical protein
VSKVQLVLKVLRAHRVLKALRVHKVVVVLRVLKVHRVHKVVVALKVLKVLKVLLVLRAQLVSVRVEQLGIWQDSLEPLQLQTLLFLILVQMLELVLLHLSVNWM